MVAAGSASDKDGLKAGAPVSLSVFFPCFNEEGNIARVVTDTLAVLESIQADYEVIIVNDGSRDQTAHTADQLARDHDCVKVIHHPTNLGYGAALQSGFKAARKELVFYTDGDGQFDVSEMLPLLDMIQTCDIVSCFRLDRQDSFMRKLNGWCWTRLVSWAFGLRIRDIDCAFKLYRRAIFDDMMLCSKGALIDTEILARAVRKGYRIEQRGVHHFARTSGEPSGANWRVVVRAFKELFQLRQRIVRGD